MPASAAHTRCDGMELEFEWHDKPFGGAPPGPDGIFPPGGSLSELDMDELGIADSVPESDVVNAGRCCTYLM